MNALPIPVVRSVGELTERIEANLQSDTPDPAIIFRGDSDPRSTFDAVSRLKPDGVNPQALLVTAWFGPEVTRVHLDAQSVAWWGLRRQVKGAATIHAATSKLLPSEVYSRNPDINRPLYFGGGDTLFVPRDMTDIATRGADALSLVDEKLRGPVYEGRAIPGDTVLIAHGLVESGSDGYLQVPALHGVVDKTPDHLAASIINSNVTIEFGGFIPDQRRLDGFNQHSLQEWADAA